MPYWDDGSGQSKSQYDSSGGYDNTGNQNNNNRVDPSLQEAVKKQAKINKAVKDAVKDKEDAEKANFRTTASQVYSPPTFAQNFKNNIYQNSLNRNKVLAMRKMSLMKKSLPGMYGALISGMTGKVPDWAQNMTEEEIKALGADIQGIKDYNQATYNFNLNPTKKGSGSELLGRVFEGQDLVDNNSMTQTDYERLFPGNIQTTRGGNNNILPQYAMMGGGADLGGEDAVEDVEEKTYDYRFGDNQDVIYENYGTPGYRTTRAEGGIMGLRARRAFGGIMDRVTGRKAYGLGSIFKSVKKAASKVLSSDIGKAAMIGAGIYYGGGGTFKPGGSSTFKFGNFFSNKNPLLFSANDAGEQVFNPMKFAGLITAGGALAGPAKQDSLEGFGNRGGSLKDSQGNNALPADIRAEINEAYASGNSDRINAIQDYYAFLPPTNQYLPYPNYAQGGRIGKAEGGLMDLGGMEKDYRSEGGFVPIGEYEKKDDVPARLSVNEFVFTADAVRGAGQGDIDKGAEIMENMMKNLENGGTVSEESQGNKGAQNMFKTSERLGAVI